jgi:hypothetical protein
VKLDFRFASLIDDRIKAVKRIAEREGYKDDLSQMCDQLLQVDEIRTYLAHGFMTVAGQEGKS